MILSLVTMAILPLLTLRRGTGGIMMHVRCNEKPLPLNPAGSGCRAATWEPAERSPSQPAELFFFDDRFRPTTAIRVRHDIGSRTGCAAPVVPAT